MKISLEIFGQTFVAKKFSCRLYFPTFLLFTAFIVVKNTLTALLLAIFPFFRLGRPDFLPELDDQPMIPSSNFIIGRQILVRSDFLNTLRSKVYFQNPKSHSVIEKKIIFGQSWKYSDSVGNIRTTLRAPIVRIFPTPCIVFEVFRGVNGDFPVKGVSHPRESTPGGYKLQPRGLSYISYF